MIKCEARLNVKDAARAAEEKKNSRRKQKKEKLNSLSRALVCRFDIW